MEVGELKSAYLILFVDNDGPPGLLQDFNNDEADKKFGRIWETYVEIRGLSSTSTGFTTIPNYGLHMSPIVLLFRYVSIRDGRFEVFQQNQ